MIYSMLKAWGLPKGTIVIEQYCDLCYSPHLSHHALGFPCSVLDN